MSSTERLLAVALSALALGCLGPGTLRHEVCQSDGRAVVQASCVSCHTASLTGTARAGSPEGTNFDTDGDLRRHAAKIRELTFTEETMPPGKPMAACNRSVLEALLVQLEGGSCLPSCSGRACGDDGCGGSCGSCASGLTCAPDGQCIQARCTPSCEGAACGPDGCGGVCGACSQALVCTTARACVCQPQCSGRVCGPDGCGGVCGACAAGSTCAQDGKCVCVPSCSGKICGDNGCGGSCGSCAPGDSCLSGTQCECVPSCGNRACGPNGCGGTCGSGCNAQQYCDSKQGICKGGSCTPSCTGKVCGDNGCGGSCGPGCAPGQYCTSAGQCACVPSCVGKSCGDDGCGGSCGSCANGLSCTSGQCGCTASCAGRVCGSDGCGGSCGPGCPSTQSCNASGQCGCTPSCSGKSCGDDGCGGSCGTCTGGASCVSNACSWPKKSYAADVHPIWQRASCGNSGTGGASCHSGNRPAENLDLSTAALGYGEMLNQPSGQCASKLLVKPGDVAGSYLINKLTGVAMCSGSLMPKADGALSAADLEVVRAWIGSGAAP
jgi:hypothetical protein